MGGTAGETDSLQATPAASARLAFPPVDLQAVLESAAQAAAADVIADRRATGLDRPPEHPVEGTMQLPDLTVGQVPARAQGADPGGEEGFIGVNVPHPGDDALVQQQGFDGPSAVTQSFAQVRGTGVPRFRPKADFADGFDRLTRWHPTEAAEATDVTEAQFLSRIESKPGVDVFVAGFLRVADQELSRHAQVDDQRGGVVQPSDDPFATTLQGIDASSDEIRRPDGPPGDAQRSGADPDRGDGRSGQQRAQVADHGFDFGEFGHVEGQPHGKGPG